MATKVENGPARVSVEFALMEQMIPGKPITPDGKEFAVVNDRNAAPIIFFVGTDGQLVMAARGPDGNTRVFGLSKRLGVTGRVNNVAASQAQSEDMIIYVAFTSSSSNGAKLLYLLKPFRPDFDWDDEKAKEMLLRGDELSLDVERLWLTPHVGSKSNEFSGSFPSLYVSYSVPGRATDDICAVSVDSDSQSWRFRDSIRKSGEFQLSNNPQDVLAIVPGNIGKQGRYAGLFVLSREVNAAQTMLRFVGYDASDPENPALRVFVEDCPDGATSLTAYADRRGTTALLIGGDDLCHYAAEDLIKGTSGTYSKLVSNDQGYRKIRQMLVAQSPCLDETGAIRFSLWFLNGDNELHYDQFRIEGKEPHRALEESIPLIQFPDSGGVFRATYAAGAVQRLFTLFDTGQIQMLTQDDTTRHWGIQPLSIPTLTDFSKFTSYTTVVQLQDADKVMLPGRKIHFASSERNEFVINGGLYEVDTKGIDIPADDMGRITIILPVGDLGAPTFTFTPAEGTTFFGGASRHVIDPAGEVNCRLDKVQSAQDLKNMVDEKGNRVFEGKSDEELAHAAQNIIDLRKKAVEMQNGNPPPPPPAPPETKRKPWDLWPWLSRAISTVKDVIVKGATMLLSLAKGAVQFVLNTLKDIGKAISTVLDSIGAALGKLLEMLGDALGWGDVKDMQRILSNFVNVGLYWTWTKIDSVNERVEAELGHMRAFAKGLENAKLPDFLEQTKVRPGGVGNAIGTVADGAMKTIDSPAAKWVLYQLEHAGKAVAGSADGGTQGAGAVFQNLFANFRKLMTSIIELVQRLWTSVAETLKSKGDISIADFIRRIGKDSIDGVFDILKNICNLVIRFMADIIARLAIELNKKRDFPVLSAFWKVTTGSDLTFLDVATLAIALPLTMILKLAGGAKPRELGGISDLLPAGAAWKSYEKVWQAGERAAAPNLTVATGNDIPPLERPVFTKQVSDMVKKEIWEDSTYMWRQLRALGPLAPIIVPLGSSLIFNFSTVPGWVKKDQPKAGLNFASMVAFTFEALTVWLTIPWHKDEEEQQRRMIMHSLSALRAQAVFAGPQLAGAVTAITAQVQVWGLIWVQVSSAKKRGNYDARLAIKEWITLVAVMSGGIAPMLQGEPISIAAAVFLNNTSNGYQLALAIEEFDVDAFKRGFDEEDDKLPACTVSVV